MQTTEMIDRRHFLGTSLAAGAFITTLGRAPFALADEEEDVSAVEDLMREHGALNRVLLIYEELDRRLQKKEDFKPATLHQAATIIRNFIENYHEKLEEEYVFPTIAKSTKYAELAKTLKTQHDAGRKITDQILSLTTGAARSATTEKISPLIADFNRMYRPHEAFEDTVAFPEFKHLTPKKEYDKLGRIFEEREHKELGQEGFEGILVQITEIEKGLGIHDIRKYTPKLP